MPQGLFVISCCLDIASDHIKNIQNQKKKKKNQESPKPHQTCSGTRDRALLPSPPSLLHPGGCKLRGGVTLHTLICNLQHRQLYLYFTSLRKFSFSILRCVFVVSKKDRIYSSSQSVSNIPTELREHLASPKAYVKVKVSIKNSILLHSKQVGFYFVWFLTMVYILLLLWNKTAPLFPMPGQ